MFPSDPTGAPYRRLCVLKNLKGIAYEARDPKNFTTTAAEIVSNDPITGDQLGKILDRLNGEKLFTISLDIPEGSHDPWLNAIHIRNLKPRKLNKLVKETRDEVNETASITRRILSKLKLTFLHDFGKRHPHILELFLLILAGLIVYYVTT